MPLFAGAAPTYLLHDPFEKFQNKALGYISRSSSNSSFDSAKTIL